MTMSAHADTQSLKTVLGGDKYSHLIDRSINKRSSDQNKSMFEYLAGIDTRTDLDRRVD